MKVKYYLPSSYSFVIEINRFVVTKTFKDKFKLQIFDKCALIASAFSPGCNQNLKYK